MVRTQISITEEQAERLRAEAASRGVSQASLLRDALDEFLARRSLAARIDRARSLAGAYRSGCGNLAEDHDEYLVDAFSA